MASQPTRLLLGPQRPDPNLGMIAERAGLGAGPIAVISAGWQEAENDIDDVRELVQRPLQDLRLYQRAEALFEVSSALRDAYRQRQETLKEQQRLYSLRLRHLMQAARQVLRSEGSPALLAAEQRHAIAQLRALDRHHLRRVRDVHAEFARQFSPERMPAIAQERKSIVQTLEACSGVLITGGNVIVLLNRLMLFGMEPLLRARPVVAWSAGAMALMQQVVLFHDHLPQGRRDAELLGPGLGIVPGYIILPDTRRRVRTTETLRASLFCRRFAPATCVTLDSGSFIQFSGARLTDAKAARRIKNTGKLGKVRAS
jgi:hypothetical protein